MEPSPPAEFDEGSTGDARVEVGPDPQHVGNGNQPPLVQFERLDNVGKPARD
jgi:hypothetical protein